MRRIYYNLEFNGTVAPVEGKDNLLDVAGEASSSAIRTVMGPRGVKGAVGKARGEGANFESRVTVTGTSTFTEKGRITFGAKGRHGFTFATVGEGVIGPGLDKKVTTGAVTWRVVRGFGQFKGAKGYITSNFSADAKGRLTDRQIGYFFVK